MLESPVEQNIRRMVIEGTSSHRYSFSFNFTSNISQEVSKNRTNLCNHTDSVVCRSFLYSSINSSNGNESI